MSRKRKGRRGHGEGSVFAYRDGFAAVLDLGWVDGKRRRRWVYGKTQAEVLRKFNEQKRLREAGVDLTRTPPTFGNWLDEWLTMKRRQGTRPTTLRGYRWLIETHVRPTLGRVRLDKLTPTMIRRVIEAKRESGLSTATVRHVHGLIRNALADAEREELVHRNVAKAVRPPSLDRAERRGLTLAEARRLIDAVQGDRLEALWVCALTLGLRRGELLGLRWADVDFDAGTVGVSQTVLRVDGQLVLSQPKTARSRRVVPAPSVTLERLRVHKATQARARLGVGDRWTDLDLVFPSSIGTAMEPRNLDRAWQSLRATMGLDWLRLHDLRHACATFMLASGASPRTVMKMLGHSQIALTMNTYAHVLPELEREAVDDLAQRLFE